MMTGAEQDKSGGLCHGLVEPWVGQVGKGGH